MVMPTQQLLIQIALVVLMGYGTKRAFDLRASDSKGLGVRFIQILAVIMIPPTILILALEGMLKGEGIGTALGVLMGYTLSGILKPVPGKAKETGAKEKSSN